MIDEGMDKITSRSISVENMDATDITFPKLSYPRRTPLWLAPEEDLRNLTLGVYQVGLAKSFQDPCI